MTASLSGVTNPITCETCSPVSRDWPRSLHHLIAAYLPESQDYVTAMIPSPSEKEAPTVQMINRVVFQDSRKVSSLGALIDLGPNFCSKKQFALSVSTPSQFLENLDDISSRFSNIFGLFFRNGDEQSLTDADLLRIVSKYPNLQHLTLLNCWKLTDSSVASLGKCCSSLENLDIGRCRYITDASISSISLGCPHLQALNLSYCNQITGAALAILAQQCSSLQRLYLIGCEQITGDTIEALRKAHPNLDIRN